MKFLADSLGYLSSHSLSDREQANRAVSGSFLLPLSLLDTMALAITVTDPVAYCLSVGLVMFPPIAALGQYI